MDKKQTDPATDPESATLSDESPPIFSKWRTWYAVVIANLIVLIILFAIFTEVFK